MLNITDTSTGNLLRDLTIKVGPVLSVSGSAIDTSAFNICTTFTGPAADGSTESLLCAPHVMGQIVVIEKTGSTQPLSLCEVEVFPGLEPVVLNKPCYWNHDCEVAFSECMIIKQGRMDFNFTCQCKNEYVDVEGRCVAGMLLYFSHIITVCNN